jgi:serine O-acetyltransferase
MTVHIKRYSMQQAVQERRIHAIDPLWDRVRAEAHEIVKREPELSTFLFSSVLSMNSLEEAVMTRVASRLDHPDMPATLIRIAAQEAAPDFAKAMRADLCAVIERDPACARAIEALLYFKGFHAIQAHRLAHWLWHHERKDFALYLQSRSSAVFQVDIHPACPFGQGVFFDHATGIVIGQTAALGNDVSILQGVTLGGNGKERGDRHPKIGDGVLIGAGANVLGNIKIGNRSRVAAGSVVLMEVPPCKTVAGVPAKIVGDAGCDEPSRTMEHGLKGCDCC